MRPRPYLGKLDEGSKVYQFISAHVSSLPRAVFHVTRLARRVLRYTEEGSGTSLVGKFLDSGSPSTEFENLRKLEALGLCEGSHRVIRALGRSEEICLCLLSPFVPGEDLDYYLEIAL